MKTETFLLLFPVGECLFEIRVGKKSLNKILKKAKIIRERLRHSIRSKSSVQWVAKKKKINCEKIYTMPITTKKWLISRIYQNFYKSVFKQDKQHNRTNRQEINHCKIRGYSTQDHPPFWHPLPFQGGPKTILRFDNLLKGLRIHWKLLYSQLQFITGKD